MKELTRKSLILIAPEKPEGWEPEDKFPEEHPTCCQLALHAHWIISMPSISFGSICSRKEAKRRHDRQQEELEWAAQHIHKYRQYEEDMRIWKQRKASWIEEQWKIDWATRTMAVLDSLDD